MKDTLLSEEELREKITEMVWGGRTDVQGILELIQSQKIAHGNMVIGEDREITTKDVYGDDWRNNIGHHELEVVREWNNANRKLRAEQRGKVDHVYLDSVTIITPIYGIVTIQYG